MGERQAYVIDDEKLVRSLVGYSLAEAGIEVEEFESSEAFLLRHKGRAPGCIIVDIGLPGMDGLDLLEIISKGGGSHPVVVLSANGGVPNAVRAGRLGVVDFIEKPFRVDELIAAVEKAFDVLRARQESGLPSLETLTRREREVLVSFIDGSPNKVVAHSLGLSVRTVELHRANMMKKLRVRSLSQALLLAKEGGYV
jgi:two-component system response regulator FixJ